MRVQKRKTVINVSRNVQLSQRLPFKSKSKRHPSNPTAKEPGCLGAFKIVAAQTAHARANHRYGREPVHALQRRPDKPISTFELSRTP